MSPKIYQNPCCQILRLVLEATTPLAIGAGRGNGVFDSLLVRDGNGLPGLPGTSLAGVLRHRIYRELGRDVAEDLFGSAHDQREAASRVHVSWGCLHDQEDQPVEGLILEPDDPRQNDPLLTEARLETPIRRDHVRLDHRGAAVDTGQFDRTALHAGYRFTVELTCWYKERRDLQWAALEELLRWPGLRLGGASRSGFGALKLVCAHKRGFDLRDADDLEAFAAVSADLGEVTGWQALAPRPERSGAVIRLQLEPEDGYRFGGGDVPIEPWETEKAPKLVPVTEPVVVWDDAGRGSLSERRLLIPGSGVKGAIRHRFAYHYHRHTGTWADDPRPYDDVAECPGVRTLFGHATDDREEAGQAGRLFIDDLYLPLPRQPVSTTHNAIDRFTGGVRRGVLFSQQTVAVPLELEIAVDDTKPLAEPTVAAALRDTLEDLCTGRLALGSGGGRGLGTFQGEYSCEQLSWKGGAA